SAFEAVGEFSAGKIDAAELLQVERHACPGAGSCGGMFTANTMSSVIEAMGMSLPYSSTMAAEDAEKAESAAQSAAALVEAIRRDLRPRQIMTRQAFENAIAVTMAIGGSTNAVLHLLAIARAAGVPLVLDDFETIRARVPVLCDLKPSGRFVATDLHRAGRIPQLMKILLTHGVLHGDALSVTGRPGAAGRGWAPRWRSSPTGDSPAARTAWWSATSRPRRRSAAPSRWCRRAIVSRSTPSGGGSTSTCRRRSWPGAGRAGRRARRPTPRGCWRSMRSWSRARASAQW